MLSTIVQLVSLIAPAIANPLQIIPSTSSSNNSLSEAFNLPTTNNTNDSNQLLGCFSQTSPPRIFPTNRNDCEAVLDNWVQGQDLAEPRTFTSNPSYLQDVLLPITRAFGTCVLYMGTVSPGSGDTLTLAEIYAEVLGPDGLARHCLGPRRLPGLGGTMKLGPRKVIFAAITGRAQPMDSKG